MAVSDDAVVLIESGAAEQAPAEVTSIDNQSYSFGYSPLSRDGSAAAEVVPFGLATGGAVTNTTNNDEISVAALTAYMPGIVSADANGLITVAGAASIAVARPAAGVKISSLTVNNAGAFAMIPGTDGPSLDFTGRGGAGQAPEIPVDSFELAQTRLNSTVSAPITVNEISQIQGQSQERFDFPIATINYADGTAQFSSALPLIHTGGTAKKVFAKGAIPQFLELAKTSDWVPAESSASISSTTIYGRALGSSSRSISEASFTAYMENGITDPLVGLESRTLWVKFFQDRNRAPFQLTQGIVSISRTFPADDQVQAAVTIAAEQKTENYAS